MEEGSEEPPAAARQERDARVDRGVERDEDPDAVRAHGAAVAARWTNRRHGAGVRRDVDVSHRSGVGWVGPDDYRGRRGLQSNLPLRVAICVRPLRDDGRVPDESTKVRRMTKERRMKKGRRIEFVSTRSRIEKLGVKRGSDVLLLGIERDKAFVK